MRVSLDENNIAIIPENICEEAYLRMIGEPGDRLVFEIGCSLVEYSDKSAPALISNPWVKLSDRALVAVYRRPTRKYPSDQIPHNWRLWGEFDTDKEATEAIEREIEKGPDWEFLQ